ncbi:hypothetical protein Taro_033605 [Colocasia esculenta]|uniref:Uncharacterized protein n=1 Tax=Colocasia esculenta TaxID=4460 RepID=A0A843W0K1_COLES|nr:hypothetical protein [Colocasia esculenta]
MCLVCTVWRQEVDGHFVAAKFLGQWQSIMPLTPVSVQPLDVKTTGRVKSWRWTNSTGNGGEGFPRFCAVTKTWSLCLVYTALVIDSVDTPIDGVDTGSESLKLFHEDRVKCVDTAPGSVDTRPSSQETQLPDWDRVST